MSGLLPHSTGEDTESCEREQLGSALPGSEWDPSHWEIRSDLSQNLNFTGDFDSPSISLVPACPWRVECRSAALDTSAPPVLLR